MDKACFGRVRLPNYLVGGRCCHNSTPSVFRIRPRQLQTAMLAFFVFSRMRGSRIARSTGWVLVCHFEVVAADYVLAYRSTETSRPLLSRIESCLYCRFRVTQRHVAYHTRSSQVPILLRGSMSMLTPPPSAEHRNGKILSLGGLSICDNRDHRRAMQGVNQHQYHMYFPPPPPPPFQCLYTNSNAIVYKIIRHTYYSLGYLMGILFCNLSQQHRRD